MCFWSTRSINLKCLYWMFRTVEISMQGSKKMIIHTYWTLQMWKFRFRFFSEKMDIQSVVMENFSFKKNWNIFKTLFGYFAESGFYWINQKFALLFLFYATLWCPIQTVWKRELVLTEKLKLRTEMNQSEMLLLDVSHCRNFTVGTK